MTFAALHFTPEQLKQADLLLNTDDHITISGPEAQKRLVIMYEDTYEALRASLHLDQVDLPFFDCERVDSPDSL